jgi:hypothetical protein
VIAARDVDPRTPRTRTSRTRTSRTTHRPSASTWSIVTGGGSGRFEGQVARRPWPTSSAASS